MCFNRLHKIIISFVILLIHCISFANATTENHHAKQQQQKKQTKQRQKRLRSDVILADDEAWVANIETAIYRAGTFENINIGYSAKGDWDLGLSLVNIQMLGPDQQFQGDTFFNIAKTINFNEDFFLVLGTQNGVAISNPHPRQWYNYDFIDAHYFVNSWLSLHGGVYLGNNAVTGHGLKAGILTGTEITLIPNTASLQLDYSSGHHALSGAIATVLFTVDPHCQVYLGVSVPETRSGNEFAGLIGINLSTKEF